MALKDIFTMVKSDKYTQDGLGELIKAQEAETEDKVYQNGEISQKTGLMKTPNGWVKPPKGKTPGAKKETTPPKEIPEKADAESKPASEPKHTLEVGSEVKFKRSGQPITIKEIENYGGTPVVVGEYDYNGKRETNRFRLDELEYDKEEKKSTSENKIAEGNTVKFRRTGQPIKIKSIKNFGGTQVIEGEYEHNGKTETNLFRMDEISTDSAPRVLTGDTKIRVRKETKDKTYTPESINGPREKMDI